MRDIKLQKHASRKSEAVLQKIMRHSGELRQKRTCWTDANRSERSATATLATKNRCLRANRQMVQFAVGKKKSQRSHVSGNRVRVL